MPNETMGRHCVRPARLARAAHALFLAGATLVALAGCDPGRKVTQQVGYRGVAQEVNYDVSELNASLAANVAPAPLPPAAGGPPGNWQNVRVLTDISATEFTRTMQAMSNWVAPKTGQNAGCLYCHSALNFAADSYPDGRQIYTKAVARRMLQMTRHINSDYRAHVQNVGVTCYSCHRGQPVPAYGVWYFTDENQYLRHYLDRPDVRVQSVSVTRTSGNQVSIKQAYNTYALMVGMAKALGVNCTYCHNSRSWATWQNAPPSRLTALYGLRMVRDVNLNYLTPLQPVWPSYRVGHLGDSPKLQCVTCHQGAAKPLYGAKMAKDYPALWGRPGPWDAVTPADTAAAGYRDFRTRDSIPEDGTPILHPQIARPRPSAMPGMRVTDASTPTGVAMPPATPVPVVAPETIPPTGPPQVRTGGATPGKLAGDGSPAPANPPRPR